MRDQKNFDLDSNTKANSVYPLSANEEKSSIVPPNKEEFEGLIKYPETFNVSQDLLVNIVKEAEKRKFSEEIDKLESIGGDSFLEKGICTSFSAGFSTIPEELLRREEEYGHNRREEREPESFWSLLWGALQDFTLRILLVCACVSIILEVSTAADDKKSIAWIDGFAIFLAVCFCSTVQAGNDYQKEKQFQKLYKVADDKKMISVIRDGQLMNIHNSLVLVGDVVIISEGMDIPADGYVIEASELLCDESSMTGETEPLKKFPLSKCCHQRDEILKEDLKEKANYHSVPSCILLSGSRVLQGEGKFIVIVVGPKSCIGRIQAKLEQDEEITPLQKKLEHLARGIGNFGLYSAILIFTVLIIRFIVTRVREGNFYSEHLNVLLSYLMIAITVVVVAIPEGLPLSVVISLAYSVKKMLKDNNLVRRLHACETMGGANMICSDKTGTLTQNQMTMTDFWNEKRISIDSYQITSLDAFLPLKFHDLFLQSTIVNSSAILKPVEKGSSTEIAFLKLAEKCSVNYEDVRNSYVVERKLPFTSTRKRMGTIIQTQTGGLRLVEKGASEMLLDSCTKMLSFNDELLPMTESRRSQINDAINDMAKDALRTLVIAYKDLDTSENMNEIDPKGVYSFEKYSLTLIGVVGIRDILRKEVPNAVLDCIKAGIKVRMVTGDNKITARAIARECHIVDPSDEHSLVLEGAEFMSRIGGIICENCVKAECDCANDEKTAAKTGKKVRKDTIKNAHEYNKIYKHIDVLARSRPEDKYAMVVGLKERGHVVAVTGDGTNDAPALKKADVGFAMGISGTEVAREAAAIILLDDNFSSLVKAVLWGRNIYDSIRKFLQFQLTVNVVAVGITLIGAVVIQQEVLTPIQMLWINLIMDTFASLALATEPPHPSLLRRKPVNRNEYMISKKMFKHIIGQAIYQLVILMILIFDGDNFIPEYPDSFDAEIIRKNVTMTVKYNGDYVRSGRYRQISGSDEVDYEDLEQIWGPSRHFTVIFNTFVMLQIFNFLNARRIRDELNIFSGFFNNYLFLLIVFVIIFLQAFIVTHGSVAFHVYNWYDDTTGGAGLTIQQWFICIGFGAGGLIVSFLLKFFPEQKCLELGNKSNDPLHDPSKILEMRRGDSNRKFSNLIHQNTSFKKNSFNSKSSFAHKNQVANANMLGSSANHIPPNNNNNTLS